jgi:effector-binding domain-containing protein
MTSGILENQELLMTNVLSFRKTLTAMDFQRETERIGMFVGSSGLTKTGPTVTATFAVEGQVMDIEILIPLDKPFTPPEGCTFKAEFRLINAVVIRHTGNPSTLQESCDKLMAYVQERGLQPITCGYNVTGREALTPLEIDQMIVDVYIGISPNIL